MRHFKTIVFAMFLTAAAGCSKNGIQSDGNGKVLFSLTQDEMVADLTRSNVSDFTALPASGDFTITITNSESSTVWSGKISEWDSSTLLPAGNYSVEAAYGASDVEGFDCPYFHGSKDFAVVGGQTTTVSVPVTLANTVVRIVCTQQFKNWFRDWSFKFTRDGADIVAFAKDESRGAFIDGYKITLEGTFLTETRPVNFSKEYTNLDEATAYTFNFDVTNVGGATLTVSFNNTTETIDLGDYELNN